MFSEQAEKLDVPSDWLQVLWNERCVLLTVTEKMDLRSKF